VAHHHHVEHAHVFVGELVLAQVGHALAADRGDVAGRAPARRQDLHEGGLAGAVGADQAVAVAVAELDGDVLEQGLGPELHGDVGEGLSHAGNLSRLQRAFHEHLGSQCGFCTPGMIMAAEALLRCNPRPDREQIKAALAGNLCRCTGYVKIIESVEAASRPFEQPA
jgi:hypothetical protein